MENQSGGVKTKKQIADEYGVCRKTFNKLLLQKRIKLDRGLILPKNQLNIYDKLGVPDSIRKFQSFSRKFPKIRITIFDSFKDLLKFEFLLPI